MAFWSDQGVPTRGITAFRKLFGIELT